MDQKEEIAEKQKGNYWLDDYKYDKDNQPNLEFNINDNRDIMIKITKSK